MRGFNWKSDLLKLFSIMFIAAFSYILYTSIFNSSNFLYDMNSLTIIIGIFGLLIFLYSIDRCLNKLSVKKLKYITVSAFFLFIILLLVFAIVFTVKPGWDFGVIVNAGMNVALGDEALGEYFYNRYPNNIGITILLGYIFKLVHVLTDDSFGFLDIGIAFNLFMIILAVILLYLFIYQTFGFVKATLFSIFMLFITPLYAYAPIVYTDTMTMVFPIAILLLLSKGVNSTSKFAWFYYVGIGLVAAIGTILKMNISIMLIAVIIYVFFTNRLLVGLKKLVDILVPFLIVMILSQQYLSNFIPIPYKEAGLPSTHWIMMGLKSPYGGYSSEDVHFSNEFRLREGKQATKQANIKMIQERLKKYGVTGYIHFLNNKIAYTWGDGTYFAPKKLAVNPVKVSKLHPYIIGSQNGVFTYISQFSHVVMLLCILISSVRLFIIPNHFSKVIHICLFGVFLFLILWETRSRYLVCYLPVLIVGMMYGLDELFKLVNENTILNKTKKIRNVKHN
ncbi:MAG: glycosyltransferase family 39 protein [Bacillaceae bacterium]